ncbi:Eco57I restriction-modification methylase domain-containing protein [Candidatus Saccharibacteria bacterium]|nr:Eco57I restriction-modification methylase domain-containing protein [Candidatus Saccharibacteria bacterium]
MHKKEHGQFFTENNPFTLGPFKEWFSMLPENAKLLEPFAGSNNLVKMINDTFGKMDWGSFDIEPPTSNAEPAIQTKQLDTIKNMPEGFDAIITNPPYLARNSATRAGIPFDPDNNYDDLYKYCLEKMLEKYNFVAAIIPESFITSNQFRKKLYSVISLTQNMFGDTDCPVCLAMFVSPEIKSQRLLADDFYLYRLNKKIGQYSQFENYYLSLKELVNKNIKLKFNDKTGIIGLRGVDNTNTSSIKFIRGEMIDPDCIKVSSRAITRISVNKKISDAELDVIINQANALLRDFRNETNDIFMTSFKGLRKDGKYRRRLDFKIAGEILNITINGLAPTKEIADDNVYDDLPLLRSLQYAN